MKKICHALQDLPQCGSNLAATDAVLTMQALVATEAAPDAAATAASRAAAAAVVTRFLEARGLPALLQVMTHRLHCCVQQITIHRTQFPTHNTPCVVFENMDHFVVVQSISPKYEKRNTWDPTRNT